MFKNVLELGEKYKYKKNNTNDIQVLMSLTCKLSNSLR